MRAAVLKTMETLKLDAFVYPTWGNPPRLIGDLNTPHGDNRQIFSPTTGFPAINVPMGYTRGVLPAGITFFGRAWSEPTLIRLAYAYEQATRHRYPPASTPLLRSRRHTRGHASGRRRVGFAGGENRSFEVGRRVESRSRPGPPTRRSETSS
jgi:amidase